MSKKSLCHWAPPFSGFAGRYKAIKEAFEGNRVYVQDDPAVKPRLYQPSTAELNEIKKEKIDPSYWSPLRSSKTYRRYPEFFVGRVKRQGIQVGDTRTSLEEFFQKSDLVDEHVAFKLIPLDRQTMNGYNLYVYRRDAYAPARKIAEMISRRFNVQVSVKLDYRFEE